MDKTISFTTQIKEEISTFEVEHFEARSIIAGFLVNNGSISFSNKIIKLSSENYNVIKFIYKLLKENYPTLSINFAYLKEMKLNKKTSFVLHIKDYEDLLDDIEYNMLSTKIPYSLQDKEEKIRGYLIGAFLACGSCTNPESSNYHFEFCLKDEGYAKSLLKLIQKIKYVKFDFKSTERRTKTIVYLKKSDQISSFLAFINCQNTCLEFEDIRVNRDMSNTLNRMYLCDAYNFQKSLNKSKEILDDINTIEKSLGDLKYISNEKLRELCIIKKENPESSYDELAKMLAERIGTSVSKSNVSFSIKKIHEMAGRLKDENQ